MADARLNQTVLEGVGVALDGSASTDPDGSIDSYDWKLTTGTGITLSAADAASPTFTAPQVTSSTGYTFTLTVTDDDGLSDADTVTITVRQVNRTPSADAGVDQTVLEGVTVTLDGSASSDSSCCSRSWTARRSVDQQAFL